MTSPRLGGEGLLLDSNVCRTLGVVAGGYYAWRNPAAAARARPTSGRLRVHIRAAHARVAGPTAARACSRHWRRPGECVGRRRVMRLMRGRATRRTTAEALPRDHHSRPDRCARPRTTSPSTLRSRRSISVWAGDITALSPRPKAGSIWPCCSTSARAESSGGQSNRTLDTSLVDTPPGGTP